MKASDADRPCRKLHFRSFWGEEGWLGLLEAVIFKARSFHSLGLSLILLLSAFNMVCLRLQDSEGTLSEVVFYGREYRLHSPKDVRF